MKELISIQSRLNAPKGRTNQFGHFRYRSAEDILAAVKPILREEGCFITLTDEVREVGQAATTVTENQKTGTIQRTSSTRIYIRATATITNAAGDTLSVSAWAREEPSRAGMDAAQVTGAASSYARKYALCGLLAIDNEEDTDTYALQNGGGHGAQNGAAPAQQQAQQQAYATTGDAERDAMLNTALQQVAQARTKEDLVAIYTSFTALQPLPAFKSAMTARRKALGIRNAADKQTA